MKPFISVIIPCRNEARFLSACLASILAGDYPPERMEVLVVDGMSTDGTRELISFASVRDFRVRRVDNPRLITPCALNRGIEEARGEIIARVDAHATVAPDYLSLLVGHLERSGADNAGGRMRTLPQDPGPFAEAIVAVLGHRFGVGNSYFRIGTKEPRLVDTVFGGCWRREVFDRIGRFNEKLLRTQDMEFSLRLKAAGGKTLLAPDVWSDYYARSAFAPFWRHNFLNGEWAVLPFLYSDAMPVSLRHLVPLAFAGALGAAILMLPWSGWPLAAILFPYLGLNLAASIQVASRQRKLSHVFLLPLAFLNLHLGYGLGSAWGLIQMTWLARREDHAYSSVRARDSVL